MLTIRLQQGFIKMNKNQSGSVVVVNQLLMPKDGFLRVLNADKGLAFVVDSDLLKNGLHNNLTIKIPDETIVSGQKYKVYIYSKKNDSPIRSLVGGLIEADVVLR